jgi:hypothetical protein
MSKLPKIGLLYMDYVLRFFDKSNFKGWPDKIETVVYHWGNDKDRLIKEIKSKGIEILIGNIPATAYDTFVEISKELPEVRFVPSLETQFPNKSKENVTLFCDKHNLSQPKTWIFYNKEEGYQFLKNRAKYPVIIKRSYGPSNYGGYYVHYIKNSDEAIKLLDEKKYNPIYIQEALDLQGKDIRVMLIGHKPICAFWRVSADANQKITNTSQGGYIDYDNIPMDVLELAVEASKAAKAEYWACDIAYVENKPYILECATAFAAFPYVRDWIGDYLMWDFSNGKFRKPYFPLFNWEQLGKIDSSLLRTMRHIQFSPYTPSCDGAFFVNKKDAYDIEITEESNPEDVPENPYKPLKMEEDIPDEVKNIDRHIEVNEKTEFENLTLTKLLSLQGMDEELATKILELIQSGEIKELKDLMEYDYVDEQLLSIWLKNIKD